MTFTLDDLGPQSFGDTWLNWRLVRDPQHGSELALGTLARGGFVLVDPHTGEARQVRPPAPWPIETEGWAAGQAPDGSIYQATFTSRSTPVLLRWNWQGEHSQQVIDLPARSIFTLDVADDGRVYMPDALQNTLFRYDPKLPVIENLGTMKALGTRMRNVCCGRDGLVYLTVTDFQHHRVVAYDPVTQHTSLVCALDGDDRDWRFGQILKDRSGQIWIHSKTWQRVEAGVLHADASPQGWLAQLTFRAARWASMTDEQCQAPLVFSSGWRIARVEGKQITVVNDQGQTYVHEVARQDQPLRIFSVTSGNGKIWGGTFIPLTLFAYDPATRSTQAFGNPTQTEGEIYAIQPTARKVYLASYYHAVLTAFDPLHPDQSLHLGHMKPEGLPLHRPYGNARDAQGRVFFAARGDYGCFDSGLCRIDPTNDQVTRWIYPNTTFGPMCYLTKSDQLLIAERRRGESSLRATLLSPEHGQILQSTPLIEDEGEVVAWLYDGAEHVYGVHAYRACIFLWNLREQRMVARREELPFGDHCYSSLLFGPDQRVWGLTNQCVYAVSRDLQSADKVVEYEDAAMGNFYRFGMCLGPDGAVYFPNGSHLMRVRQV